MKICLHSLKFGVWYAVYRKRILDNCSLKTQLLRKIIQLFDPFHYLPGRRQMGQLVSANFHIANTTTDVVQNVFGNRIIGHGFWPPRSPSLISPDFFLREFLKERVNSNNTRSLEDFKHNNEGTTAGIDQQNLLQVAKKKTPRKGRMLFFKRMGGKFQHLS